MHNIAKKAALGLFLYIVTIGLIIPVAFWMIAYALDKALGWHPVLQEPISQVLAATALLIGVFWMSWSYSYLHFVGKGVPFEIFGVALHPTRYLVTTGPYAYVRNPGVIGMLFILLGVAFLERSLAGLILVPITAALLVTYHRLFEENGLHDRFGAEYDEYKHNVPLLIPRLTPYIHKAQAAA